MRTILLLAVLGAAGWFGYQQYFAPPPGFTVSREADASQPFVVKIHADWCQTCVDLGPVWTRLDAEVGSDARMVVLDVTDEDRFQDTARIARYLGIGDFLEENMEKTGTIAVLHGASRAPVAVFKGEKNLARYRTALERARKG